MGAVNKDEHLRRRIIERGLGIPDGAAAGGSKSIEEFNHFYGATPKASIKFIQSPATWSLSRLDDHIRDNGEFMAACKLKWAFRIKPDLVVTDREQVHRQGGLEAVQCLTSKRGSFPPRPPSLESRGHGLSWPHVGDCLGVTRASAWQRYSNLVAERDPSKAPRPLPRVTI